MLRMLNPWQPRQKDFIVNELKFPGNSWKAKLYQSLMNKLITNLQFIYLLCLNDLKFLVSYNT